MEEGQFIARVFSTDSLSYHPENRLSSFTSEFDTELDLGDGYWELGIKQLFLNPTNLSDSGGAYVQGRDILVFPKESRNFATLQSFINFALGNSSDPTIFTPSYSKSI